MHWTHNVIRGAVPALLTVFLACLNPAAFAASDTWNQPGGSHSWNSGANWLSGTQYPDGTGDVAYFTNDITSAQTVTVSPSVTVGGMVIGDANGSHAFTIGLNNTQTINLDNGASANFVNSIASANTILAKLVATGVNQDLTIDVTGTSLSIGTASTSSPMTIDTLTKNGSGDLFLGTAGSTFTDPNVYLNGGRTFIFNTYALPTNSVVTIAAAASLHGGGGRDQAVAEIRGTGMFRDGSSSFMVVGDPAGVPGAGTYIRSGGRLRPGDLTAIGQVGTLFIGEPSAPAVSPRFESGSESYFDIASYTSFDQIDIRRTTTTINGGDVYINFLSGFSPTNGAQFKLFINTSTQGYKDTNGGAIFDNIFDNDGIANPFHGYFQASWGDAPLAAENPGGLNARNIVFTYLIPEPSAAAFVMLSAAALLLRRRS